jgi:hypothetical protein
MGVRMSALGRIAALARNETQTKQNLRSAQHMMILFSFTASCPVMMEYRGVV